MRLPEFPTFTVWEPSKRASSTVHTIDAGEDAGAWLDERAIFLGQGRSRGQALVSPELEKWVSERLQEESAVLKERRKGREERMLAAGLTPPGFQAPPGAPPAPRPKASTDILVCPWALACTCWPSHFQLLKHCSFSIFPLARTAMETRSTGRLVLLSISNFLASRAS